MWITKEEELLLIQAVLEVHEPQSVKLEQATVPFPGATVGVNPKHHQLRMLMNNKDNYENM